MVQLKILDHLVHDPFRFLESSKYVRILRDKRIYVFGSEHFMRTTNYAWDDDALGAF